MKPVDRARLPVAGPPRPFRFPAIGRRTLANGLDVRVVEHHAVPVVCAVALVRGGSAADPSDRPGLAAFAADLLDDGAGDLDGVGLADAFARLGAEADIEVWPDATVVSITTLARHAERALALLADLLLRPRFAVDDVERVRSLRVDRLRQMRAQASALADRAMSRALYGAHPYGHLGMGQAASLRATTVEDITNFHYGRATPGSTSLVVVGAIEASRAFAAAEAALGGWQGTAHPVPDLTFVTPPARSPRTLVVPRVGAPQSELRIGQVGASRDTVDYHELLLWNAVLGGQFISRLNLNLRQQKGYTYGVRSGFDFRRGRGPFSVQTSVQSSATAEAVHEVFREIAEMCDTAPVTPEELTRAKAAIGLGYPRGFETASQVARSVAQLALHGLADDHFERFTARLDAVDVDHVTAAARRHVDADGFTTVVVGDPDSAREQFAARGIDVEAVADEE